MPDLEPITREEKLWSGENIVPITREEMYIKHIYDKTQKIPSKPITRKEMLLERAGEGGGSDVTIKQLSVTANGTYSQEGTAYSPVIVNVPKTPLNKLTVTENGTYTAPTETGYDEVNVNVPLPSNAYLLKEIEDVDIASFSDGSNLPMPKLQVGIEPVQDLHGYDSPWVGGAGKNKLPMTVDGIKTANTSGTWSGNVYSINNGTFTILTDSNENVIGIKVNGTFSTSTVLNMDSKVLSGNYVLNGCPSGGDSNTYRLDLRRKNGGDVYTDNGSGVEVSGINESVYGVIRIQSGYSASNITFSPMLRLSTETDATFAPYSNICPISGWDECKVTVADDTTDPTTENVYTIDLDGTRYGGTLDVVSGELKVVPYYASYNGETLEGEWISDRDVYAVGTTPTIGAQVVNIGATHQTYQLTPTQVKSLLGSNNVWADTGDITDAEYFSKEV